MAVLYMVDDSNREQRTSNSTTIWRPGTYQATYGSDGTTSTPLNTVGNLP